MICGGCPGNNVATRNDIKAVEPHLVVPSSRTGGPNPYVGCRSILADPTARSAQRILRAGAGVEPSASKLSTIIERARDRTRANHLQPPWRGVMTGAPMQRLVW